MTGRSLIESLRFLSVAETHAAVRPALPVPICRFPLPCPISILRGRASAVLGSSMVSTPFSQWAVTWSGSSDCGRVTLRSNRPYLRS